MQLRGLLNRRKIHWVWRAMLFVLLFALLLLLLANTAILTLRLPNAPPKTFRPGYAFWNECLLLFPAAGATLAMAYLENAPIPSFGLAGLRRREHLLAGALTGLAGITALVITLLAAHAARYQPGQLAPAQTLQFALEWAAVSLMVGFTEELTFRGYLFATISRAAGWRVATLLTSLLFALSHGLNAGETLTGLAMVFALGLLLSLAIHLTRSLWWAIGFHSAWDFGENDLFGTPDSGTPCYGALMQLLPHGNALLSGGQTGPEGSLLCLPLITLLAALLYRTYPRHGRT